jgi:hypothetical protein
MRVELAHARSEVAGVRQLETFPRVPLLGCKPSSAISRELKAQHGIVALFNTAVIALDVAIKEPIIPMFDLAPQYFLYRPWV